VANTVEKIIKQAFYVTILRDIMCKNSIFKLIVIIACNESSAVVVLHQISAQNI
jgi:hypothetical protein